MLYYAITSKYGFGVYIDHDKYERNKNYVYPPYDEEVFNDDIEAINYAMDNYNYEQADYDTKCTYDAEQIELDWYYKKSDIEKMNLAEDEA
ncbi:MAG: hypothetical protein IKH94_01300 [Eubacterium sp.]|nr:hypothetical protein [Eubacterium sp.]